MTPREQQLSQQVELLRRENELLRQKIDLLVKRVFASSREQLDSAQMQLLLQGQSVAPVADVAPVVAPKAKPAQPSRSESKPRLPVSGRPASSPHSVFGRGQLVDRDPLRCLYTPNVAFLHFQHELYAQ